MALREAALLVPEVERQEPLAPELTVVLPELAAEPLADFRRQTEPARPLAAQLLPLARSWRLAELPAAQPRP